MTFDEYLAAVAEARVRFPHWSDVEVHANLLRVLHPEAALIIRGSTLDPTVNRQGIGEFLRWLETFLDQRLAA